MWHRHRVGTSCGECMVMGNGSATLPWASGSHTVLLRSALIFLVLLDRILFHAATKARKKKINIFLNCVPGSMAEEVYTTTVLNSEI